MSGDHDVPLRGVVAVRERLILTLMRLLDGKDERTFGQIADSIIQGVAEDVQRRIAEALADTEVSEELGVGWNSATAFVRDLDLEAS